MPTLAEGAACVSIHTRIPFTGVAAAAAIIILNVQLSLFVLTALYTDCFTFILRV